MSISWDTPRAPIPFVGKDAGSDVLLLILCTTARGRGLETAGVAPFVWTLRLQKDLFLEQQFLGVGIESGQDDEGLERRVMPLKLRLNFGRGILLLLIWR